MYGQALILLVGDDYNNCTLIQRAFAQAKVLNPLVIVRSGDAAIDYLRGLGRYANRVEFPFPSLVLLDSKMSGMGGLGLLQWIRDQPGLRSLRVVMLTSSDDMKDVKWAFQLRADSYLIKPVDFEKFVEVSRALSGCWLWMDKPTAMLQPPLFAPINPQPDRARP